MNDTDKAKRRTRAWLRAAGNEANKLVSNVIDTLANDDHNRASLMADISHKKKAALDIVAHLSAAEAHAENIVDEAPND